MKVLIIDDEIGICKYLQRVLKKEGCKVNYTTSAVGVIEKIYRAKSDGEPYELLLIDLRMPKVSGFELLKKIREAQLDLDVIIITGYGDEEKAIEAVRLGAVDYLPKPISLEDLHTAIYRIQQKRVEKEKEVLMHSILVVDNEKDLCNHIKQDLDKEGYKTAVAYDGDEGLDYFRNNRVDMIITETIMPKMSGLEMLKKCKEITNDFESIVITGHSDHEKVIAALKLGIFNYLRKPILIEELVVSAGKGLDFLLLRRGLKARRRELEIEAALREQYSKNLEETVEKKTRELKKIKNYLQCLMNSSLDLILSVKKDGTLGYFNRRLKGITGYTEEEIMGKQFIHFIPDKMNELMKKSLEEISKGIPGIYETKIIKKDKTILDVQVSLSILEGYDEFLVVLRDITKHKQVEKELQKRLRELEIIHKATLGREGRIIELKQQVNELLEQLGKEKKYNV